MKVDNDLRQLMYVVMTTILELYKIGMGTFLIYFVPQKCDDHVCQMMELTPTLYHRIGLCINVLTLGMFLFTYMWELRREKWCLKHLDTEKSVAYNNLIYILPERLSIEKKLRSLNLHYIRALRLTSFVCCINFISSGYVIYTRYLDNSTITSYLSFVLLILTKLRTSYSVGKQSYHKNLALSALMTEPLSFNILDRDQYSAISDVESDGASISYEYSSLHT